LVPPLIKDLYKDNVLGKGYENAISSIYELPSLPDPEINLLIVGARYGPYDHISAAKHIQNINIVGIEPDPQECERLRKNWPNCTFHQTAIGGRTGKEQLYILKHPGKSSVYEPNFDVLQRWGIPTEKYELTESHSVEVTTLDKFTSTHDYEFDFIQIDTQGAEGDIISGGKKNIGEQPRSEF
jgi:FkbM family methyltransferase